MMWLFFVAEAPCARAPTWGFGRTLKWRPLPDGLVPAQPPYMTIKPCPKHCGWGRVLKYPVLLCQFFMMPRALLRECSRVGPSAQGFPRGTADQIGIWLVADLRSAKWFGRTLFFPPIPLKLVLQVLKDGTKLDVPAC